MGIIDDHICIPVWNMIRATQHRSLCSVQKYNAREKELDGDSLLDNPVSVCICQCVSVCVRSLAYIYIQSIRMDGTKIYRL